tara:strand:- start:2240 stop:2941 length:702 start_codon:yes stop_codon:yes gene_type:complete
MNIFDYDFFKEKNIQDERLDIISKDLNLFKVWEPYQTEITKEILKNGNNIFIDVGTHLGYYSLLASSFNNVVYSIEKNKSYIEFFKKSIQDNQSKNIRIIEEFVDNTFSLDNYINQDSYIKLVKCDIEGNEIEFINSILERLKQKKIENLIIEISPQFRNNYPEHIMKIINLGYFLYDIGLSPNRKIDCTKKLESLKDKVIDINNVKDMTNYVNSFPEKQSNFLFSTINYTKK